MYRDRAHILYFTPPEGWRPSGTSSTEHSLGRYDDDCQRTVTSMTFPPTRGLNPRPISTTNVLIAASRHWAGYTARPQMFLVIRCTAKGIRQASVDCDCVKLDSND